MFAVAAPAEEIVFPHLPNTSVLQYVSKTAFSQSATCNLHQILAVYERGAPSVKTSDTEHRNVFTHQQGQSMAFAQVGPNSRP
mmetsp:Transcript_18891/g.33558  ORF Transcript_18891/g.33558 Transcript_18891/m.33558 type:complete len:83 (+) Transcript_18891:1255-1503(+)